MHWFQGNIWDYERKPQVTRTLGYPLAMIDRIPEITEARNIELGPGLQDFRKVKGVCPTAYLLIYHFVGHWITTFVSCTHQNISSNILGLATNGWRMLGKRSRYVVAAVMPC
ncbi:hypothetical protein SLEP1_g8291 [Rubroshorea leprosula]|uniref:Uncharacterized protein n=1 Tax=Rubroshorea leprosula TaxID=152421 RepID=A0AAV5IA99_9ROSI|nr:hypothetical protein SLEP1_g8291 [Rubroshorea leprosula]